MDKDIFLGNMVSRDSPSVRLFVHDFHELRGGCDELLAILDALEAARQTLDRAPETEPPGFFFLKKQALGLGVRTHKCLRLLARLRGREDAALREALAARLAETARLLPDDVDPPGDGPLVRPLRDAAGNAAGCVVRPAALRLFLRENGLMPRINHVLQQTEGASDEARAALFGRVREMLRSAPLPVALSAALSAALSRGGCVPEAMLRPLPLIRGEDGRELPLPGLAPLRADQLERGFREAALALFGPETLALLRARGLRHERLDFSLRCPPAHAAAPSDAPDEDLPPGAAAPPVDPANSPAAAALRGLCRLAGVFPEAIEPGAPPTLRELALRCREGALRACFRGAFRRGALPLAPGLAAELHCLEDDADAALAAPLPSEVLAAAAAVLRKRAVPPPADGPEVKNSVLLGRKYCTLVLASPALLLEVWEAERGGGTRLSLSPAGPPTVGGRGPADAPRAVRTGRDLGKSVRRALASALRRTTDPSSTQPA